LVIGHVGYDDSSWGLPLPTPLDWRIARLIAATHAWSFGLDSDPTP
jgi:hypothetical protein